jgi:hypothetical protein
VEAWRVEEGPAMAAQIIREHTALGDVARTPGLTRPQ